MGLICKVCKQGHSAEHGNVTTYLTLRDSKSETPHGPLHGTCYVALAGLYRTMGIAQAEALFAAPPTAPDPAANVLNQAQRAAALIELMQEARIERSSHTAYKRVLKALKVLGFTPEEGVSVLWRLQYHELDGKPMRWLLNKMQQQKGKSK